MPRKLLVALGLGAVVLALVCLAPWPIDDRMARHNLARTVAWVALLAALPWPRARRLAQALGLMALVVSLGDALDAAGGLELADSASASSWSAVRLLRGLLGLAAASLVLWSHTRTEVILWSSGEPSEAGAER